MRDRGGVLLAFALAEPKNAETVPALGAPTQEEVEMTNVYGKVARLAVAGMILAVPVSCSFGDRSASGAERSQVAQALRDQGFTRWDDIELDDGYWEVDDAVAADGNKYDLKLNQQFEIIERKRD
jgi:hypothetical protein